MCESCAVEKVDAGVPCLLVVDGGPLVDHHKLRPDPRIAVGSDWDWKREG